MTIQDNKKQNYEDNKKQNYEDNKKQNVQQNNQHSFSHEQQYDNSLISSHNHSQQYLQTIKARLAPSLATITTSNITDAAVLIAITDEINPQIMLTRRASHMHSHAGEVSFAGGKHEEGDSNNIATALREAEEETNLLPSCVEVVGQLNIQTSKAGLSVQPIVAIVPAHLILQAQPDEIARIFWVDLAWLIEAKTLDYDFPYTFDNQEVTLQTPSWHVDNEIIWGLTGRILANMLEVVFDRKVAWYYRPVEL